MKGGLKNNSNTAQLISAFDQHLNKQLALLETLAVELKGNVALMCYEKDHEECHRRSVAHALAGLLDKTPIHLGVDGHGWETSGAMCVAY